MHPKKIADKCVDVFSTSERSHRKGINPKSGVDFLVNRNLEALATDKECSFIVKPEKYSWENTWCREQEFKPVVVPSEEIKKKAY